MQALPRIESTFRLLMQLRLLLVGITMLLLVTTPFTVSAGLALGAAAFSSWLATHYWRRIMQRVVRHPILLALDVVVALVVMELGGPLGPFFLFTVVTSAVSGLLFGWRGLVYFCSLQILCYYAALGTTVTDVAWSFQAVVGQPAYYPVVGFVGIRVRRLLDEQGSLAEARRQAEVNAAAADERARIARELHDSLAKTLRGIAMSAQALPMWVERSPERAAKEAHQMASTAEVASQEARELISDLRSAEPGRPPAGLIRDVAEEWADETGTAIRIDVAEDVTLSVLGRYEGVAILKEALTNIERHANAEHVDVSLTSQDSHGVLLVHDDGDGFELDDRDVGEWSRGEHYGLIGMRERATRADGDLTVFSGVEQGTTIRASFPLSGTSDPNEERAPETNCAGNDTRGTVKQS